MLMSNQQSAELTEPCVGSFDDPAALISPQFAPIFVAPLACCSSGRAQSVRCRAFSAAPAADQNRRRGRRLPFGLLSRAAFGARHADFGERGFRKRSFSRRGTFQPNSQRKTLTVDQYHPLRALATLGFTDCGAPFFAGAKLPSKKGLVPLSKPSPSSAPSRVRHASSQTPCSSHCFSRRQQVDGEGNSSGRKRHAAPVCRIQRMPSKQARFGAQGRPRRSRRSLGLGSNGSISFHCSSVNSFCRFFMKEAHQLTRLHKSSCSEAESIYETRSRRMAA